MIINLSIDDSILFYVLNLCKKQKITACLKQK
jgi:hypothetical protein